MPTPIMRLSRRGMNAKGLPSAFDQGVDFGAQSAAAAPDNLLVIFWRARRRCAGEPRTILLSIASLTYYQEAFSPLA